MEHKIKMAGFDLDGTLLTTEKKITEYTKKVLEKAAGQGIVILPVTGRALSGIPKELLSISGIRYVIASNGARIVDMQNKETLYEKLLPDEKARKILDIFEEYDTLREVYYDGTGYAEQDRLGRIMHYVPSPAMAEYIVATRISVDSVRKKMEEEKRGMDKIQALFADQGEKKEAWEKAGALGDIEITGALHNNIEINAKGVDKGAALLMLGERLGIKREEILAFGDGANDTKMIKIAGIGVAMSNGIEEVISAADMVTFSNDDDGVARFIEKEILAR